MNLNDAVTNVKKACRLFVGTLDDHEVLQASIRAIEDYIKTPVKPNKTEAET